MESVGRGSLEASIQRLLSAKNRVWKWVWNQSLGSSDIPAHEGTVKEVYSKVRHALKAPFTPATAERVNHEEVCRAVALLALLPDALYHLHGDMPSW